MKRSRDFRCFRIACLLSIASILWFLFSFLLVNVHVSMSRPASGGGNATWISRFDSTCQRISATNLGASFVKRVVLMVVDALRAEVLESGMQYMPFLNDMITNGSGYAFKAKVQPPTVTMPRIKAIISGEIPAYLDLLLNFDSKEFRDDNLLFRMRARGLSSVFYGDETWLRMFPGHFKRSEGTSSFVVTDYTQVDNNVTRHLDFELQQADWSLMILHYLGLDHIGHCYGDKSRLISLKLREMDDIASRIYNALHKNSSDFLLLVLGDHGMSSTGSHGGASSLEANVAVFAASPHLRAKNSVQAIDQVDLVPTLALLMNLPIPERSVGLLIGDLVRSLTLREKDLCTMYMINLCQFVRTAPASILDKAAATAYQAVRNYWSEDDPINCNSDISVAFEKLFNELRRLLLDQSFSYNILSMTCALATLIVVAALFCLQYGYLIPKCNDKVEFASLCLVSFPVIALLSTSYVELEDLAWHFILCTLMVLLVYHSYRIPCDGMARCLVFVVAVFIRFTRALYSSVDSVHMSDMNNAWNFFLLSRYERNLLLVTISLVLFIVTCLSGSPIRIRYACYPVMGFVALSYYKLGDVEKLGQTYWSLLASRAVYALSAAAVLFNKLSCRTMVISVSLLQCLLLKSVHLLVYLLLISLQLLLGRAMLQLNLSLVHKAGLHYALAQYAFYAVGNSNSLSTIDTSVAYVGLTSYQPVLSAALVFVRTYGSSLVVWILFWRSLNVQERHSVRCFVFLLAAVSTAFYMVIIELMRAHLFIWSVFAPKLLYLSVSSGSYFVALLFSSF
uniref:GPI ethanolamine phosphate transferase 2 n=1 Tax=Trichuris muris TaxID=70415 RepID=A0A5S6QD44_TRIMR